MQNSDKEFLVKRLDTLREERKVLDSLISETLTRLCEIRESEELEEIVSLDSESSRIQYYLFEDGHTSDIRYEKREEFWRSKGFMTGSCNCVYEPGISPINQIMLSISMKSSDNSGVWVERVEEVFPYIKPSIEDGCVVFDIIDNKSVGGNIIDLRIKGGKSWIVKNQVNLAEFENLRETFDYIRENYSYEG